MKRTRVDLTCRVGLTLALILSLGLIVVFLMLAGATTRPALAQGGTGTVRVAETHSNAQDIPDCGSVITPCETIQYAVDEAQPGEEVLVAAGTSTGVNTYGGRSQVVYISKTLDLRGGYTHTNWAISEPDQYPTTIDADGDGRVIMITGPITVTVEGFEIMDGDGTGQQGCSGATFDCGGGVYASVASLTLLSNKIHGNRTSTDDAARGGGVHVTSAPTTTVLISDCDIHNNTAAATAGALPGYGGGVYQEYGGVITVQASRIMSNTASEGDQGGGGGIATLGPDLTVRGSLLRNNTASTKGAGNGGAVYLTAGTLALEDNQILSNTGSTAANAWGGGVYVESSNSTVTLTANTISNNVASVANDSDGYGGGISIGGDAIASLTGNTFSGNTAASGAGSTGKGGGIYTKDLSSVTLDDNTIQGNTASDSHDGQGGGVYAEFDGGEVLLKANDILSNTASGGLTGERLGGGIYVAQASVTLEDNKILGNRARSDASSSGSGGGIAAFVVEITMTNNLVADNWGPGQGDGMLVGGAASSGLLIHNTFAGNGVQGGNGQGIYFGGVSGAKLAMTDTIISGHAEAGLVVDAPAEAELEATLWYGNAQDTAGTGTITTGTIDLHGDPAYVDAANWDYHLSANSAAIDQGIDAGVYDDLDGVPRPALEGFDIGAYEFPYGVSMTPDLTGYGQSGEVVTYTHTLTNEGKVTDTFTFSYKGDLGWGVAYGGPYTLAAGVTETVVFGVQVPATALSGTEETTVFTATSGGDALTTATVEDVTKALLTVGIGLEPDGAREAAPGEIITYTHTLTNTGNWTDTLTLEASSSQGWAVADSGTYILAAKGERPIVVTVTIPAGAPEGQMDITVLTATSSADAMKYALVTDTTTVKLVIFKVYLPVVLKNQ